MLDRRTLSASLAIALGLLSSVAVANETGPHIRLRVTAPSGEANSPDEGKTTETDIVDLQDDVDVVLLGLLNFRVDNGSPYSVIQVNSLKIPFMRIASLEAVTSAPPDGPAPSDDENPFQKIFPVDQPLFSLFDVTALLPKKEKGETDKAWHKRMPLRLRILDSLGFCLFQRDGWNDHQYCEEWLEMPLVRTFAREKTKKRSALHFLNVPFVNIVRHVEEKDESETKIVDAPGVAVFAHERSPEGKEKWDVLRVPMFALFRREKDQDVEKLNAVGVSILDFTVKKKRIDLDFSLFRRERNSDGRACDGFLHVPLLGPLFAKWGERDSQTLGLVPRLLRWKDFRY